GHLLTETRRFEEAQVHLEEAIRLNPKFPDAHNNLGLVHGSLQRPERAMACYEEALKIRPDRHQARLHRGMALLAMGRPAQGRKDYESRHWSAGFDKPKPFTEPYWDGSPLDGRTIFLCCEQGLGDTLHFIRYAAELKRRHRCRVVCEVQKPIVRLLS